MLFVDQVRVAWLAPELLYAFFKIYDVIDMM